MHKSDMFIVGFLLMFVMAGVCLQPLHNQRLAEFSLLFAGTPDEYGNQILNVNIDQDVGGSWINRGIVTSANYTPDIRIEGFIEETTRFRVTVALNYSWADSSSQAIGRSNVYISINTEVTSQEMSFSLVDLVSQDQGWLVSYSYIWDTVGKPDVGVNSIGLRYSTTGPSKNYNLTYYDASFDITPTHWVDGSNTTDLDWVQYCNVTSADGILTITQGTSAETGFIAADDGITIDSSVYPFFQIRITEVSGCRYRLVLHNGGWVYLTNWVTDTGTFTFNIDEVSDDPTLLRIQSDDATIGDYIKVDYYNFYAFANWVSTSSEDQDQYALKTNNGVNITGIVSGSDPYYILKDTSTHTILSDSSLVVKFRTSQNDVNLWLRLTIDAGYETVFNEGSTEWTTLRTDISAGSLTITELILSSSASGSQWVEIKWIYIETYGFLNQSLTKTENGGTFGKWEDNTETSYEGYGTFTSGGFEGSDFTPMHGLGAVTVVLWVNPLEPEQDGIYFSQYVDDNNRIEIGFDGIEIDAYYRGNMTFTIGNGSTYERIEARVTTLKNNLYQLICVIASWEKGNNLSLTVNGTEYISDNALNGVVSADDDLSIASRDGSFSEGPSIMYGLSFYYRELSTGEKSNIYSGGPEETSEYLYHHYGFNEYLLGYGSDPDDLHSGEFSAAIREIWNLDYIGGTLAGYLAPNPLVYPEMYIWLGGWILAPFGICFSIYQFRKDKENPFLSIGFGLILAVMGIVIIISGV